MNPLLDNLLPAFKQFQLVFVAIKIGLFKSLATGPASLEILQSQLNVPAYRLHRLLRGLIWAEAIVQQGDGQFAISPAARRWIDDSTTSPAGAILFQGNFFYHAWGHLADYVATGQIPFEKAHGRAVFDLLQTDHEMAHLFNHSMADRTSEYSEAVAMLDCFALAGTVVDIGGGNGRLMLDLLNFRPNLRGIVFDLPMLKTAAEAQIAGSTVSDRCVYLAGDMFQGLPGGADIYLAKWILHDWNDLAAQKLLNAARQAMSPASQLLIIERIMPEKINAATPLIQPDLNMLCLNGGSERTLAEYGQLLDAAGLKITNVLSFKNDYGFQIIQVIGAR